MRPFDEPTFSCRTCLDCGWELFWCYGEGEMKTWERPEGWRTVPARHCGRQKPHARHSFAERCVCWQTNPVILKRREAEQARQAARESKRKGAA